MKADITLTTHTMVTQRVQQAIALLPMSSLELNAFVREQLDTNPFLMEKEPLPVHPITHNSSIEFISNTIASNQSVLDDLISQIRMHTSSPLERFVGTWIIHHLDERGFFTISVEKAAQILQVCRDMVEKVLHIIRKFDPVGVGARSIVHCWRIQLEERGGGHISPDLDVFLQRLDDFSELNLSRIVRSLNCSTERFNQMLSTLRSLHMYPFHHLPAEDEGHTMVSDILSYTDECGRWQVCLNTEALPRILLDRLYLNAIRDKTKNDEDRIFVQAKVSQARWLVQALAERAANMLKVAEALLHFQYDYWVRGASGLSPMTLKDVAERTGLHASTVSRLTTNKYIQMPKEVLPLKFFFSRSLTSLMCDTYDNVGASSKTIQHRLRQFVREEHHQMPYSDNCLVRMFQEQGILVARRTINKYRQIMNIPPSNERKRLYSINPNNRF